MVDKLRRRGMNSESFSDACVLCQEEEESIDHLLICPFQVFLTSFVQAINIVLHSVVPKPWLALWMLGVWCPFLDVVILFSG